MTARAKLHVGTSGYQYPHWKGRFYPEGLPKSQWFAHYAAEFDTVEINNTFYNLPSKTTFDTWRDDAPRGFRYALKYSRYGSHLKHLKDPEQHVGQFVGCATRLGRHLGPILVQLPPGWNVDMSRLEDFLATLPREYRWVVEFRNETWLGDAIFDLLRKHRIALCIHDLLPDHPHVLTTNWTYLRFHGPPGGSKYTGSYSHQKLTAVARRLQHWLADGHDIYVYFNNDDQGYAVDNARDLRRYVGT